MLTPLSDILQRQSYRLLGKSGFHSSGQGLGAAEGGVIELVMFVLIGAFLGALFGIMLSHLLRFTCMLAGRQPFGFSWTIYGTLLGMALFAVLAFTNNEER